jgi:ParB family chromosome partitioning protein
MATARMKGLDIDLDALDSDDVPAAGAAIPENQVGIVLELPLDKCYSEAQARTIFEGLESLAESMKKHGQMQPIKVAAEDLSGLHKILQGERRWRAARIGGLPTIKVIVEDDARQMTSYAQVAENKDRDGLKPIEFALFIQDRITKFGEKKKFIAEQLGEDASFITRHLAILEAPAPIREAFDAGRLAGADHVYDLSRIHAKNPEAVEEFLATAQETEITRRQIQDLSDQLVSKKLVQPTPSQQPGIFEQPTTATNEATASDEPTTEQPTTAAQPGAAWPYPSVNTAGNDDQSDDDNDADNAGQGADSSGAHVIPFHNPDNEKTPREPAIVDPTVIKKPLMLATYKKRDVMVNLYKKPTTPGLVFIKYEDGSGEEEVSTTLLKNWTLTDAKA